MQTKEITDALGITRERIKYYKKEGTHLCFQVKDGDQPVDPLLLLQ